MAIQVRYLSKDEIERDVELLLAEYGETIGESVKLPIPVDDITTYHLALRLGLADLHETLGVPMLGEQPDILGAIWVEKEAILIDQSLDPKCNPSMQGRYRFSVGHEIGHWRLHRSYVTGGDSQTARFDDRSGPSVICRSSQANERIEWQANYYASSLLMPRRLVIKVLRERFYGRLDALIYEVSRKIMTVEPRRGRQLRRIIECADDQGYRVFADEWAEYFAQIFAVSTQAMRIRLETLGLLRRDVANQSVFA